MSAYAKRTKALVQLPDARQPSFNGVAPVTVGDRLGWLAEQPLRSDRPQRSLDIDFWDPMRNQLEMFLPRAAPSPKATARQCVMIGRAAGPLD